MSVLMNFYKPLLSACLMLMLFSNSFAHQGSEGYVRLTQTSEGARLEVDAALRDFDLPLNLDADGNGLLTSSEIGSAWPAVDAYVKSHVQVTGCELVSDTQQVVRHDNVAFASLAYRVRCSDSAARAGAPALRYSLFKQIDTNHRATARVQWAGATTVQLLNPQETISATADSEPRQGRWRFVGEGIHHIVTGYDHVLFLLCLLLPSVMRRTERGWVPVQKLRQALWPVLGIVTAFTLAHSITLTLAALQWVNVPSSLIEPLIAATIAVAALDNLRSVLGRRRLWMTFLFGLIHGFGFAGILQELQLPTGEFVISLVQFNVGLEFGQVAIVAALTGLLFMVRDRESYVPIFIKGGSAVAIAVSMAWLIERTLGMSLLPI